jgi:SAM-dependent methyltransferase
MGLPYSVNLGILNRLKNMVSLRARRRIFEIFMRECAPTQSSRVADFGVSGHREHPVHYFFEELYPHRSNLTVIARASENATWFPDQFPGLRLIEADLRQIPLPDLYFDCGICNAVIEHAGPRDQQLALVREVCRVCRRVMFTTPNKWFPVEVHTLIPLAHWLPDATYRRVLRSAGLAYFADVENVNLLDARTFMSLFPTSRRNRLLRIGPRFVETNLACVSWEQRAG